MPAPTPPLAALTQAKLATLGERIRAQRKQLGVSATATAEAAGMSRVTLHRIERGEPSVTMGAYLGAIAAIGLELELVDPREQRAADKKATLPSAIRLADYPQLKRLAWQLHGVDEVAPKEALDLYERNWRHVDAAAMTPHERELVRLLSAALGGGRLLV
jgi:transcriptional regulator with XRE-family HTH domain